MMTVRDHMKAAGYDPDKAWNASRLRKFESHHGTMECERIQIKTFRCRPDCYTEMIGVSATAIVPFTDGYEHPYPQGWPKSLEASVTAYFPIEDRTEKIVAPAEMCERGAEREKIRNRQGTDRSHQG